MSTGCSKLSFAPIAYTVLSFPMNGADVLAIGGVKEILLFISFLKYSSCKASFAFSRLALSIPFYRPVCP